MNNIQKTATILAVTGTVAAVVVTSHNYNQDLYERFPEVDRKIVRRAYRRLMAKAFCGEYDMRNWSEDQMDTLFKVEVFNLIARQK